MQDSIGLHADRALHCTLPWQVYRGRLRSDSMEVAVKVQRPAVREAIALDTYIMRAMAQQARKRFSVSPPPPPSCSSASVCNPTSLWACSASASPAQPSQALNPCGPFHQQLQQHSAWGSSSPAAGLR